jgi:hypothetical protein
MGLPEVMAWAWPAQPWPISHYALGHSQAKVNNSNFQIPLGLFESISNSNMKLVQTYLKSVQT